MQFGAQLAYQTLLGGGLGSLAPIRFGGLLMLWTSWIDSVDLLDLCSDRLSLCRPDQAIQQAAY